MPHGDPVEAQIRAAIERGEFDHLPGTGKPIRIGMDDPGWWARGKLRQIRQEEELAEQARAIERDGDRLWTLPDEQSVAGAVEALNHRIDALNAELPEPERLEHLPVRESISIWRRMQRLRG